jgi:hypothetical protein
MKITAITSFLVVSAGALSISACASAPQAPMDAFQSADIAIASAQEQHAGDFAPGELRSAQDKIVAARAAVAKDPEDKDVLNARRLADEAKADATLASARATDGRAEAVNAELQKNMDQLRQELDRGPGGKS